MFGLMLSFLVPIGAVALLAKSLAEERKTQASVSVVTICWSALMLAIPAWVAWQILSQHLLN
jgi:Na+-driven multidrug efflux pump